MKSIIVFIFLQMLGCNYAYCQQSYSFKAEKAELKEKIKHIQQVDSVSLYQTQCTAVYSADGVFKSNMPSRIGLMDFLKKNNSKIYRKIRRIDSSCQLYQNEVDDALIFELYKKSIPKSFYLKKEQKVICKLLILTVYGESRVEQIRFIISMKPID